MILSNQKQSKLNELYNLHQQCLNCPLKRTDIHSFVFGQGNINARLMIIGEAPGKNEDEQGLPFIGRSGQLLTQVLNDLSIHRSNIFITNTVKCRPPNNRTPSKKEIIAYKKFLLNEIEIIQPTVICTLGSVAAFTLTESSEKMADLRQTLNYLNCIKIVSTYHPAYILRNQPRLKLFKDDIQMALNLSKKP